MRLLRYGENGELDMAEFEEHAIPPYTILSHRWGRDTDEVTFEDLEKSIGREKPGFEKIRLCGEQTRHDNLQYFWIDTCCINKANKAELSWAIRSMFRWYRNAARCYVYLSDVSTSPRKYVETPDKLPWDQAFRESEWFTRGWTLQELLAPELVEFFTRQWDKLGDKTSLAQQIHEITGIPPKALQGTRLSEFSINERLRWKERRKTTHGEDGAYSLLGIFDVDIAPLYGEGTAGAFSRLMDEIRQIERCTQDIFITDPRKDKERIEDTKGSLLEGSYRWVFSNSSFQQWYADSQSQLLWIKGDPGKGKTMLLCGIINELPNSVPRTALVAFFFFQASDSRINSFTAVLRGLLHSLVKQQPSLISHVRKEYDRTGRAMYEGANAWYVLADIFASVLRDPSLSTTYLIIDALDECVIGLESLLDFIAKQSFASHRVKWIVSSRNWPGIEAKLERLGKQTNLSLELNTDSISMAVEFYMEHKVRQLAHDGGYDVQTRSEVLKYLASNAHDTFLWVALACQALKGTSKRHVMKKLGTFPPGLSSLYKRMMCQVNDSDDAEICKRVLAATATLYRPATVHETVALVEQLEEFTDDFEVIQEIIGLCGSFLTVREGTIYFVHQSAKDFLLKDVRDEVFPTGSKDVHRSLFSRSLKILSETLHRDMYSLKAPGYPIEDVQTPDPDPLIAARYSCIYWVDHLHDSHDDSPASNISEFQAGGIVNLFFKDKYLYWLEGLSLCKSMRVGMLSIAKLWSLVQEGEYGDELIKRVQDAHRFIMYHKWAIENTPLQTYASALIFSPPDSLTRTCFQHEEPRVKTVNTFVRKNWGACLHTLELDACPHSIAFSHDSKLLALDSIFGSILIWDTTSWECLQVLNGHKRSVWSVVFSHDSTLLASCSEDNSIMIWDTNSWECLRVLNVHNDSVYKVAFSYDSALLASISHDGLVRIWDVNGWNCLQVAQTQTHYGVVQAVVFLLDSTLFGLISLDGMMQVYSTTSGQPVVSITRYDRFSYVIRVFSNTTQLAALEGDGYILTWDLPNDDLLNSVYDLLLKEKEQTAEITTPLTISNGSTSNFTTDSVVQTGYMSDSNGTYLLKLTNKLVDIRCGSLSHDSLRVALASVDKTVKIWDLSYQGDEEQDIDHEDAVHSVVFSHDSKKCASGSSDSKIRVWDVFTGQCLQILSKRFKWVRSVVFSHDSKLLASASFKADITIWDTSIWEPLQRFEEIYGGTDDGYFAVLAFSHDSTQFACGSSVGSLLIQSIHDRDDRLGIVGHHGAITAIAFSCDSTLLASASRDRTVKIWDIQAGKSKCEYQIDEILYKIRFDTTGLRLHTERGVIDLAGPAHVKASLNPEHQDGIHIEEDGAWIS